MLEHDRPLDWRKTAPPLEFDDQPDFLAFVQTVLDAHMAEMTRHGGYAIEKGDEGPRVQSVVAAIFLASFGQAPADRFIDIFEQAAAFAYYLVRDHPFGDGNKRTAIRMALAMVALRGVALDIADPPNPWENELYQWVEGLISGTVSKEALAADLRTRARLQG
ncbi:type II toxin-antitoxin system death-on-curing family toxin [Bifidobacterium xylocopae]|uniref:Death-on-curing protein n=1 Tax=Bifidobacterium xylocopae TaxID=2493119 RepID=A0A366KDW8_9BIFI|nr:type II toxin-antitoxin system death-on-curing family toxin [Bifidobacterium xylocopae]RBP99769.1 death-on-curing protein [Bifidobacterium xylocopae]